MVCTRSSAKRRESGKVDDGQEGLPGGEPATPTQQVPRESLSHQPPGGPSPSGPLPLEDNLSASARNHPQDLAIPGEADLNDAILQQVIDKVCLDQRGLRGLDTHDEADLDQMAANVRLFAHAVATPAEYTHTSLYGCYHDISIGIGHLAGRFTTTWEQLTPEEQKKLKSWAPNAEHLIKSDRGRGALFQAWLWHILDDNIFSAEPSEKWQGMGDKMAIWNLLGQSMSILQELDTRGNGAWTVRYQLWRSLSAQLALESTKTIGSLPERHAFKVITAELGHLMDWPVRDITENNWVMLEEGVKTLDLILMCNRAKLTLRWEPIGFPFNGSLDAGGKMPPMALFEIVQHGYWRRAEYEGMPVEVVMTPAVEMRGSAMDEFDTANLNQRFWAKETPMVVAVNLPAEDAGESSAGADEASGIAGEAA